MYGIIDVMRNKVFAFSCFCCEFLTAMAYQYRTKGNCVFLIFILILSGKDSRPGIYFISKILFVQLFKSPAPREFYNNQTMWPMSI